MVKKCHNTKAVQQAQETTTLYSGEIELCGRDCFQKIKLINYLMYLNIFKRFIQLGEKEDKLEHHVSQTKQRRLTFRITKSCTWKEKYS